ncbi:hypothetical protein ACOSZF_06670 [Cytobacillus firmus]|uniref:hypothetical protein n=1 Tax=Cytobacillus firmus TaxID=1399 RepID=UPI00077CA5F4|nr:hypothetical protein [Cytobacillus firmus]MBG9543287.1 hypothetical protein [Cytobacillus firmus]MBG9550546.1 hypothetical protein [Cytobacillus firmus]MBG9553942.1 hypothetical protein [Cytobacillus firmus]MBG9558647.1 hypothetical protein [Cytobacillus firmus]MBG9575723.1 hypothetical protein [Cytobacillus firmus]
MSVFVYQSFQLKQDNFVEALKNLRMIQNYRNENYQHKIELLSPISGDDHTYAFLSTYEGLAEMELQNKKMFEDEEYKKLIEQFFLEDIVQGSMNTQLLRSITGLKSDSSEKKK